MKKISSFIKFDEVFFELEVSQQKALQSSGSEVCLILSQSLSNQTISCLPLLIPKAGQWVQSIKVCALLLQHFHWL